MSPYEVVEEYLDIDVPGLHLMNLFQVTQKFVPYSKQCAFALTMRLLSEHIFVLKTTKAQTMNKNVLLRNLVDHSLTLLKKAFKFMRTVAA